MGFQSIDDLVSKLTGATPQFLRIDWAKISTVAYTLNRWYDLSMCQGNPPAHGKTDVIGEWVYNGTFEGGSNGWTLSDAGWVWGSVTLNTMQKANAGAAGHLIASMKRPVVPGMTYRVTWTITAWTSATYTIQIGGALGTARGSAATFVEYITAVDNTPLRVIPSLNTGVATIDNISVISVHQAAAQYGSNAVPLDDTSSAAPYHGGNVSPLTKHVLNAGVYSSNMVPGRLMLIDQLLVYPLVNLAIGTPQLFDTTLPLPRYADGKGVRAYVVCTVASGATPQNIAISYTDTADAAGHVMPVTVASTLSSVAGHLLHTGTNPNNYGPFLPLASGDVGLKSIQSVTLSAANASGEAAVVLCKPLLTIPIGTAGVAGERDLLNQLPSLPRVYDGANLQWLFFAGATLAAPVQMYGYLDLAWG